MKIPLTIDKAYEDDCPSNCIFRNSTKEKCRLFKADLNVAKTSYEEVACWDCVKMYREYEKSLKEKE